MLDKGRPAKKKIRKAAKRPAPKRPASKNAAPTKKVIRAARAQEQAYKSQGRAVSKQAARQRTESQAKTQEQGYKSQGKAVEKRAVEQRRENRIKYLRRTRPTGMKLVKRELEGKGVLAKGLSKVADEVVKKAIVPSTGGGPNLGGAGGKPFSSRSGSGIATALAPGTEQLRKSKVGSALVKDILTFPAQAIPSVYIPAAAAVEAAKGDTSRGKKLLKDIDEHDPIYNLGAAAVEAAGGDTKSAKVRLKKAGKAAAEHPGLTVFEAVGLKGTAGRAAGRVMRSGAVGRRAKQAGSTKRAARRVPDTDIVERREYSKDVVTKVGQVAVEKALRRRVVNLHKKAAKASPLRAEELREKAARVDPDRLPEREVKRRVDERVAVNEDVRRAGRANIVSEARKAIKPAKREGHAVSVVAQRIVRADKTDLEAYIAELKTEFPNLGNSQKRANKTLRRELQKVVDDPKADMGRLHAVAQEYERVVAPAQKTLTDQGLLAGAQAEKAKLIPYAVRNMGATHDKTHGLVKDGEPLTATAIRAHMAKHDVEDPAFITQAPNQRGARNFNVRSERPVKASAGRRTGEATRKGTFDADPEALVEGAARSKGLADATEGFRKTIGEFAHRKNGKVRTFQTRNQALQAAADAVHDEHGDPVPGAMELQPVRIHPFGGSKDQLEQLLEDVDSHDLDQARPLVDAIKDAAQGKDGDGPWALIPKAAADRIVEHLGAQGGGGGLKSLQLANQAFRQTVLSTSPGWFAGNMIEGLGRAALAKAGPRSYVTGRRVVKRMEEIDPKAAEEAAFRMVGGGHFSSALRTHVRRGAEQFEGTRIAPIANALGKFWRTPGPKQAAQVWHAWTELVFHMVNGKIESQIQTAMLGKAIRTSELMDQRTLKLSKAAIDDAAKGLTKTENQVAFGRAVDRMYGRYSKFGPAERKAFATYTPFAAWFLNSVYFVYRTLPRDHPTTTALIASAEQATEEWRKTEGLDLWIAEGRLPGFLQGSIPTGAGKHFRASKFTPFGAFGSPTETVKGQVLPMWNSVSAALGGEDWKGQKLRVDGKDANELERATAAALAFIEATVPVYSTAKRVKEQGPSALNPLKVVKPAEKKTKKKIRVYRSGASKQSKAKSDGGFFGGTSSGSSSSSDGGFFGR